MVIVNKSIKVELSRSEVPWAQKGLKKCLSVWYGNVVGVIVCGLKASAKTMGPMSLKLAQNVRRFLARKDARVVLKTNPPFWQKPLYVFKRFNVSLFQKRDNYCFLPHLFWTLPSLNRWTDFYKLFTKSCKSVFYCSPWSAFRNSLDKFLWSK